MGSDLARRAGIPAIVLGFVAWGVTAVHADPGVVPGTYRCSSYNVSGGGGSCRNMPPLVLNADGSYRYSSTSGRWAVHRGKLDLSESSVWGPGELLGGDAVRFEYDFRGWRHTVTWTCQECGSAGRGTAASSGGTPVGVSLTLQFAREVGGVSGFAIVPVESAGRYGHNAALPAGAVQGLAWEAGPAVVKAATNRNNRLMSGRRYVVFLSWPRETIPVAVMDIPPADRDYTTTLSATLDGSVLAQPEDGPSAGAPPSEPPQGHTPPPAAAQGGLPPEAGPAAPNVPPSPPPAYDTRDSGPGDWSTQGARAAAPAPMPRCNPHIPRYAQPGCVE